MTSTEVIAAGKPIVTAAAKPTASWLRRKLRPDISESALDAAAVQLAADVARTERKRLDQLQVSPGTGIPLQFSDLAVVETIGSDALIRGSLPEVAHYYQGLSAPGRLLVVGEPGSGKTVLILHLILDLLDSRRMANDPVPVRINATGWDGETDLTDLLVEKLSDQYALHKRTARALVANGRILPVIDGLDEMNAADEEPCHAQAAVDRFNELPWRSQPLVVTCRSRVYEAIRSAKDGAGIFRCQTVAMRPLSSEEIDEYVQAMLNDDGSISKGYGHRLTALLEELAVNPTGVLAGTLRTPWMLTLAMAYLDQADDEAVTELIEAGTSTEISDLLFAAQIPIACKHQPGAPSTWRYSKPDVQNWLRTLADHLSGGPSSRTEVALHQVWLLAGERRTKILHRKAVGLGAGLAFGLTSGLTSGLAVGLANGWVAGLIAGLILGLAGVLVGASVFVLVVVLAGGESMPSPERVVLRTHQKGAVQARLAAGLTLGLVVWLIIGLAGGLTGKLVAGLTGGLVAALVIGLAFALTLIPPRLRPPREGHHEIRDDLVAGCVRGLAFGLVTGFVVRLVAGLTLGVALGLAGGLVATLCFASAACRYACATLIFRRTGVFSARPVKFLEWAVTAGLLRITGTAYQFRHETYREWLTTHPAPAVE